MSSHIPTRLARQVRRRARYCCEYCRLPQKMQEATFHIDHVKPKAKGGATKLDNLALACVTCSLRKAARTKAKDPRTRKFSRLFNPRSDTWDEHFRITATFRIRGLTSSGRATIRALGMNRNAIVAIRRELADM